MKDYFNKLQLVCILSFIAVVCSGRFYDAKSVICPDKKVECPDGNTCCKLANEQYDCCPLPNAVCCSDHLHCCPKDTTCDVPAGTCIKEGDTSIPMVKKEPAKKVENVKNVTCPGGSQCPDGNTCCQLSSGKYGCCPLPNAVCCSDHVHCCPNDYACDNQTGKCVDSTMALPMFIKNLPITKEM